VVRPLFCSCSKGNLRHQACQDCQNLAKPSAETPESKSPASWNNLWIDAFEAMSTWKSAPLKPTLTISWSGANESTTARPMVPVAPMMMIFIKYSQLYIKFQSFLTHGIFEDNNHNQGKVEDNTFQPNSLHSESDEWSPISQFRWVNSTTFCLKFSLSLADKNIAPLN